MEIELMTDHEIHKFQKQLLQWYKKNQRKMPWRGNSTPYQVWVSEIMLQQTRVDTVIPYFKGFIQRLPTIVDLAEVDDQELLKLWEGLGYYNRVKNMKITANRVLEEYDGELPGNAKELQKLKGIGEYTAGAIASISFGERVPAVDGNVLRVMARLTANTKDIKDPKTKQEIIGQVEKVLPQEDNGDFNQGLIELGALICQPITQPNCLMCPVKSFCRADQKGIQAQLPYKSKRAKQKEQERTILIIQCRNQFAMRQRTEEKLLGGLWEFPNVEGNLSLEEVGSLIQEWGLIFKEVVLVKNAKAIFTHLKWEMKGYYVQVEEKNQIQNDFLWATKKEIQKKYSVASAFKEYLALLE